MSDNRGGWLKYVLMWEWHDLARINWPGWDRDPGDSEPLRVDKSFVVGRGKSSREIATEFDDIATGAFYYRDYTEDGIPFVRDGDTYRSSFWFACRKDRDLFVEKMAP